MESEGGRPATRLNIDTDWFRWDADSHSLLYTKNEGGVGNIWRQPIAGGSPQQITHFSSDSMFSFDVPRNGKSLVIERGMLTSNVVLLRDVR